MKLLLRSVVAALAAFSIHGTALAQSGGTAEPDTLYQTYEDGPISLPLGIGLRVPTYDRVNGLSLPWGPVIRIPGGRVRIDPTVTYRSNLGKADPAVEADISFGHFDSLFVSFGRGTYTNDGWIRSDLLNSAAALFVGSDARNYFRGDRLTAELSHSFEANGWNASVWAGGQHERDWSTGIHAPNTDAPWSLFGRTDSLRMRRINPSITKGTITSGSAGVRAKYSQGEIASLLRVHVERSFDEPAASTLDGNHFTQATLDARVSFPTFGLQTFSFRGHALATSGAAPPQRFSYLGGAGTLATVDLLAFGGDRLLFVQGEYDIPLVSPLLPFVGSPVLSVIYSAGSAGVGSLPTLVQNLGAGIGVKFVKVEYHIDPNFDHQEFRHRHAVSVGFSLSL